MLCQTRLANTLPTPIQNEKHSLQYLFKLSCIFKNSQVYHHEKFERPHLNCIMYKDMAKNASICS